MELVDCSKLFSSCFHEYSLYMLGVLQRKAWSETRYRVFSTIGTILPPELTERIFEATLAADELALDPQTHNRPTRARDSSARRQRARNLRNDPWIITQTYGNSNIEEEYKCTRMRNSGHSCPELNLWARSDPADESDLSDSEEASDRTGSDPELEEDGDFE